MRSKAVVGNLGMISVLLLSISFVQAAEFQIDWAIDRLGQSSISPRFGSAFWHDTTNSKLWIFGGRGNTAVHEDSHLLNDLWTYDIEGEQGWMKMSDDLKDGPSEREGAVSCGVPGLAFVIYGGIDEKNKTLNDSWVFDVTHSTWLKLSENASTALEYMPSRYNTVSWCLNDKLMVYGGIHISENNSTLTLLSDFWRLSLKDLLWYKVGDFSQEFLSDQPGKLADASSWVVEDRLYIFGGIGELCPRRLLNSKLWMYSLEDGKWMCISNCDKHVVKPSVGENSNKDSWFSVYHEIEKKLNIVKMSKIPNGRYGALCWTDLQNNLLLYGGCHVDDVTEEIANCYAELWRFNLNQSSWRFISGKTKTNNFDKVNNTSVLFSSEISPGSRFRSATWRLNSTLCFFGGHGYSSQGKEHFFNDVWKLTIVESQNNTQNYFTPGRVFLFTILSISVIALIFYLSVCLNKFYENSSCLEQKNTKNYKTVKYSKLKGSFKIHS